MKDDGQNLKSLAKRPSSRVIGPKLLADIISHFAYNYKHMVRFSYVGDNGWFLISYLIFSYNISYFFILDLITYQLQHFFIF